MFVIVNFIFLLNDCIKYIHLMYINISFMTESEFILNFL